MAAMLSKPQWTVAVTVLLTTAGSGASLAQALPPVEQPSDPVFDVVDIATGVAGLPLFYACWLVLGGHFAPACYTYLQRLARGVVDAVRFMCGHYAGLQDCDFAV